MPTLLAQLAPQRGSQYTDLVAALAPHELRLGPLGPLIVELTPITLAGQAYLRCELTENPNDEHWRRLGAPAMIIAFFELYDKIGAVPGPLLRPI